jgi:hypothetical protein
METRMKFQPGDIISCDGDYALVLSIKNHWYLLQFTDIASKDYFCPIVNRNCILVTDIFREEFTAQDLDTTHKFDT